MNKVIQATIEWISISVGGAWLGYLLSERFHWPWWTQAAGVGLGFAVGMVRWTLVLRKPKSHDL